MPDVVKLRELLNVNTSCISDYKPKAIESICMLIKKHIMFLTQI